MSERKFKVTGMEHYLDNLMKFERDNSDYNESKKYLADTYFPGDRIFEKEFFYAKASLVPEPENEYDPNAIYVALDGVKIGYIKKGACAEVRNLMNDPNFGGVTVDVVGGKYKRIYDDEDGNNQVESDSYPEFYADVTIYIKDPNTAAATAVPVAPVPEKKVSTVPLLILAIFLLILSLILCLAVLPLGLVGVALSVYLFFVVHKKRKQ